MAAAALTTLVGVLAACSSGEDDGATSGSASTPAGPSTPASPAPTSGGTAAGGAGSTPRLAGEVVTGLAAPWGLDFLPDGSAVVTERDTARVLVVDEGRATEIGTLDDAAPEGEGGLLGVAVSPDFAQDRLLYLYLSTATDNRVVRAAYRDGELGTPRVVLDGIPNGFIHDGGRLAFGPDGYLYVSTGEIGEPALAQDPDSLAGKILRITPAGRPAPGNPDPGSPVYSTGHRNVQGLAFDADDRLWASEFGSDAQDELNLVRAGRNYGWPEREGDAAGPGPASVAGTATDPVATWSTDENSPSGLAWTPGEQDGTGNLWLASLRGERLWQVPVRDGRAGTPVDHFVGDHGRLRTVEVAPDGSLWLMTSNRDTRGEPRDGDDRILRVTLG